jgi:hypothetical protein
MGPGNAATRRGGEPSYRTTIPNGAAPAGSDVGEELSSVRASPCTANPLTALRPESTTHSSY